MTLDPLKNCCGYFLASFGNFLGLLFIATSGRSVQGSNSSPNVATIVWQVPAYTYHFTISTWTAQRQVWIQNCQTFFGLKKFTNLSSSWFITVKINILDMLCRTLGHNTPQGCCLLLAASFKELFKEIDFEPRHFFNKDLNKTWKNGFFILIPPSAAYLYLKMVHTRPLFRLFWAFIRQRLQFLQQINVKNVHLVYGTGIRTQDLQNLSLLQKPLDFHCFSTHTAGQSPASFCLFLSFHIKIQLQFKKTWNCLFGVRTRAAHFTDHSVTR